MAAAVAGRTTVTVEWVQHADSIPEDLWARCFPPPLEGKWWYSVLENSGLEDQFSFFYGVLTKDGKQIGIAPAFLMDVPIDLVAPPVVAKAVQALGRFNRSLRYQRTFFVGSVCADEGTIGLIPGARLQDVLFILQDAVEKKARELKATMVVWKDFPDADSPALDQLVVSRGLAKVVSYPGSCVRLPQGGFEEYLAGLKIKRRRNLRRKLKLSKQTGELRGSVIRNPDQHTLDEIMRLFWQTYERGKTKFEKLNRKFFESIAKQEPSWFVLLHEPADSKLVAFMLCFKFPEKVINKFIGLDYQLQGNWFLYFRLWEEAVRWVMQNGIGELQGGQTGYSAKIEIGHDLIPLNNYFKNLNPLIHFVFSKVARTVDWSSLDDDLKDFVSAHPQA